jgi:hypothetical protein
MDEYRYRQSPMRASSNKYGNCEVCGQYVSDVYLQNETRRVMRGWFVTSQFFGHRECLDSIQKKEPKGCPIRLKCPDGERFFDSDEHVEDFISLMVTHGFKREDYVKE